MSETFDKLKALLAEQKDLSVEDVEKQVKETGDMTDDEKMWLESEKMKLQRQDDATVTMDEYLAATQTLDSAEEGSDEYKKALAIVEKFESGM
jgi:hypothetical protein